MTAPIDADHTMNHVIHRALRRDLERLAVVTREPVPEQQRLALCRHVTWMLDQLHHHHVAEDEGVWPLLLSKRPDLAGLVDAMNTEHRGLAEASDGLRAAAQTWATDPSDSARATVHEAVVSMQAATLPHLDHEERDAMPEVVATFDTGDWAYLSKNHFRKGLSFSDAATSLMWDLDDLGPEYAAVVRSAVPAPVLWLISRAKGPRYDRDAAARWGALAGRRA